VIVKPDLDEVKKGLPEIDIVEEIGSGGFKVVYKVFINDRMEAFKIVQIPDDPNDPDMKTEHLRRICREVEIIGRCNTPYLVRLGSIKCHERRIGSNDYVAYSEELIEGKSLRQVMAIGHIPDSAELVTLSKCLLLAVKELNSQGVIHRDIKPENIIKTGVTDRPFVLLDLGIAFQVGDTNLTRDSQRIPGTLYYIAPEMLEMGFRQNLDYRADLYTIGLTLYEYSSGVNPFARQGDEQFNTLYRIKNEKPKPLLQLRNDLSASFCVLIDGLMKKLPALRPANIDMLLNKLEEIQ